MMIVFIPSKKKPKKVRVYREDLMGKMFECYNMKDKKIYFGDILVADGIESEEDYIHTLSMLKHGVINYGQRRVVWDNTVIIGTMVWDGKNFYVGNVKVPYDVAMKSEVWISVGMNSMFIDSVKTYIRNFYMQFKHILVNIEIVPSFWGKNSFLGYVAVYDFHDNSFLEDGAVYVIWDNDLSISYMRYNNYDIVINHRIDIFSFCKLASMYNLIKKLKFNCPFGDNNE